MMIVVSVSNCPMKLRGDITKWLMEIDTGVFVGNLNAKVRDALWNRICDNIGNGRACMAFSANNEQKLDFRICNTSWEPVDFNGIKLVRRNISSTDDEKYKANSNAMVHHIQRLSERKKQPADSVERYVVIDVETTGLKETDQIIEIGAVRVESGQVTEQFSTLVRYEGDLPEEVEKLTGITSEILCKNGVSVTQALNKFFEFCGGDIFVGYNINFDMAFLRRACRKSGFAQVNSKTIDVMHLVKKKMRFNSGYSLKAVAEKLGIDHDTVHRALADCLTTYRIFEKLKEIQEDDL